MRPKFCNRNTSNGEMSQWKVRVRTSSDHKIDSARIGRILLFVLQSHPLGGARIETFWAQGREKHLPIAPFVGARIEINNRPKEKKLASRCARYKRWICSFSLVFLRKCARHLAKCYIINTSVELFSGKGEK